MEKNMATDDSSRTTRPHETAVRRERRDKASSSVKRETSK
jgi:hypothetical protein